MIELLKLCGFEGKELDTELPRVEKAFKKLGIDAGDIERGKQRLNRYYDVKLKGVRQVFRLCMKELVATLLAREEGKKKVIYGFMAPGIDLLGSVLVNESKKIFSAHQCWAFQIVVGCIFGKIVPVFEAAEKKWLKAGLVAHCANVKNITGVFALDLFPKPDLLVTSGFSCETSSKTLDLLHELYDIPVGYVDTCQDREYREYPEPSVRVAGLTAQSLRRLAGRIQKITGIEITDGRLRDIQDAKGKLNDKIRRLRDLIAASDPLPLSPAHENLWMCLSSLTLDSEGLTQAAEALDTLYDELRERVAMGQGVVEKGAPRILATLPAGQTDPRLEQLACEAGIAIIAIDMSLPAPFQTASEDPYIKFGLGSQQHTLGFTLRGRIPLIIEGCKRLKVDGVLDRYHVGCRATVADALVIEEAVKKELGLPVLVMEWENFDPRSYNEAQFRNRFEVFKGMMTG